MSAIETIIDPVLKGVVMAAADVLHRKLDGQKANLRPATHTFTHFRRLPAIEFFERRDFAWLAAVEAATDDIRIEMRARKTSSST